MAAFSADSAYHHYHFHSFLGWFIDGLSLEAKSVVGVWAIGSRGRRKGGWRHPGRQIRIVENWVLSLLLSTVLLSFYASVPALCYPRRVLFNFSMPVTLIAILNVLPAYRGLSFGLTTVALYIGALPVLLGRNDWIYNPLIGFSLILLSTITLYFALRLTKKTTI